MTMYQEAVLKLLAVTAGAAVTTLHLVACNTLMGKRRDDMLAYAKSLRDEYDSIAGDFAMAAGEGVRP